MSITAAAFPSHQKNRLSYPKPLDGSVLDVSPPGFCWWRVEDEDGNPIIDDSVHYRLRIKSASGITVYESPQLQDPVYVPEQPLNPGHYLWSVDAVGSGGRVLDRWPKQGFTITMDAYAQPWVPADELLARVTEERPRLLFPADQLEDIRKTLDSTRKEAFQALRQVADEGLELPLPDEPDYDKLDDHAVRRLAYKDSFIEMRKYHDRAMFHCALMYLLTKEETYGDAARKQLLNAAEWDPEGISSVMAPHGDEVGLGLARSAACTYDWIADRLSESEAEQVRTMLLARGNQMLRRLRDRHDFLNSPGESHAGRLPGYLLQYAIAMAPEPDAVEWADYALRALMTVFPHWAGRDGGWAEGINYGLAYNTIYLLPFVCLERATGLDLWRRSFYRQVRHFFRYCVSPIGEITPFGDTEHAGVAPKAAALRALLQFHALKYRDAELRWWVDQLRDADGNRPAPAPVVGLTLPDDLEPKPPAKKEPDKVFRGVGWAALHSNPASPEDDTMVLFKCSPFGAVSHSHADQNSFAIMKGGKALAIAAGERWPAHGTPFHNEYVQQTMAHNALLIGGEGQINRRAEHGGQIVESTSKRLMAHVAGDATDCYPDNVTQAVRHLVLLRPNVIIVIDDVRCEEPAKIQWLLHAFETFRVDAALQAFATARHGATLKGRLFTTEGATLSQTNEWPVDPKKGYPKTEQNPPEKQWHLTAETEANETKHRILTVMTVQGPNEEDEPTLDDVTQDDGVVSMTIRQGRRKIALKSNLVPKGRATILKLTGSVRLSLR